MNWNLIVLSSAAILGVAGIGVVAEQQFRGQSVPEGLLFLGTPVTAEEVAIGQDIYEANCASCHGAKLEGQPEWRRRLENGRMPAPPHDETGHTWHHSDQDLFTITKSGVEAVVPGYESDMPAFDGVLSDEEIRAVLAYLKSAWPEQAREFQAAVSAKDRD